MRQYGAFEAKTHFSELLAAVVNGEKFIITKHGAKVAMIIPFAKEAKKDEENPIKGAIRAIKKLRSGITLGKNLSIDEMRKMGRK